MHSGRTSTTWIFRAAAAVSAAAAADPIVERMSNAGVFGAGRFTDHSNVDVIPALCVALALFVGVVFLFARRTLTGNTYPPQWLRRCACDMRSRSLWRMLPSVFAMQMAALFCMETLEQIVVTGHLFGGTIWLGGPIAVSLLAHVLACTTFVWVLSTTLQWSARRIVRIVRYAIEILRKLIERTPPPRLCMHVVILPKFIEPYLRDLQGRAPPSLPALT